MLVNPLVRGVGCVMVLVDYRRAPKKRFPSSIEDCYATLHWVHMNPPTLGGRVGEFIWRKHSNHFGWSALLGHELGLADVSPYASASRAELLAGLPQALINVGALALQSSGI